LLETPAGQGKKSNMGNANGIWMDRAEERQGL
jgi:hypothetical protein